MNGATRRADQQNGEPAFCLVGSTSEESSMASVLLPEAEAWRSRQEEIELPQHPPQPVRNKPRATHPIVLKERAFGEMRMAHDRQRADS
jgi:hypothetical protein